MAPHARGLRASITLESLEKAKLRMSVVDHDVLAKIKEDDTESDAAAGLSWGEAVSNLVIAMVGAAVTVFPAVMSNIGAYGAAPLMIACCGFLMECGVLICEACCIAESLERKPLGSIMSYEALADAVGMGKLLAISKNSVMCGTVLLFVNFLTSSLASLFFVPPSETERIASLKTKCRFFGILPLSIGLAMVKDLKLLSKFGPVGLLGVICEVGGICLSCVAMTIFSGLSPPACEDAVHALQDKGSHCRWFAGVPVGVSAMGQLCEGMSAFVFGFAVLATVPSVRSSLAKPAEMPSVIRASFGIGLCCYLICMILGYFAFGQKVNEDNIIVGITEWYGYKGAFWVGMIPTLGLMVNIIFSLPIFIFCVFSVFEASGNDAIRTPLSKENIAIRAGFVFVLTLIGWLAPFILPIIGIMSSLFCVCNNIFFPLLFFYQLRHKAGHQIDKPLPTGLKVYHVAITVVGVFAMIFGLIGAVDDLIDKLGGHDAATMGVDKD